MRAFRRPQKKKKKKKKEEGGAPKKKDKSAVSSTAGPVAEGDEGQAGTLVVCSGGTNLPHRT